MDRCAFEHDPDRLINRDVAWPGRWTVAAIWLLLLGSLLMVVTGCTITDFPESRGKKDGPQPCGSGPSLTVSDSNFSEANWIVATDFSSVGSTQTADQDRTDDLGNPGPYRRMVHRLDPSPADSTRVGADHLLAAVPYDPSTDGAIECIDASWDSIIFSVGAGGSASVDDRMIVMQDGVIYVHYSPPTTSTVWSTVTLSGLSEDDFVAGDRGTPDFSAAGSVIFFGYRRSNSHLPSLARPFTLVHGIDNYELVIHRTSQNAR